MEGRRRRAWLESLLATIKGNWSSEGEKHAGSRAGGQDSLDWKKWLKMIKIYGEVIKKQTNKQTKCD